MFCNTCGSELSAESEVCTNCGAKVENPAPSVKKAKGKPGKKKIALLAAGVGVVLLIVAWVIAYNILSKVEIKYEYHDDGTATVVGVSVGILAEKRDIEIEIPETSRGHRVTEIGHHAFWEMPNLTSIVIPDSVVTIGRCAFDWCIGLKTVKLGNGVTTIDEGAFSGCDSLTSIEIPDSVMLIGHQAFSGCENLTSIVIPNSVTVIDNKAFFGCRSLATVEIGDGVTTIGERAFAGCESLTSIVIPDSVTVIGDDAFDDCDNLEIIYQ